mmetsp:Transcript_20482/g.26549  ORF Transcript_20482/g.26549 Transcript_20482/m.26549 type:complete len:229 (-) Transcript_20482:332-1018(-)|eukprot:CAMPEP_0197318454 /NCGR_PEP_ID=MMETSP0891-20130614/51170_1 /TAXON_ID=44058 ORGANISM="Aureoumbra lagunensis, Strain CCMP1510" /NCGR_SAMPLE_ID=MMETSP0891 /ASSEMBLY_ACC=CAM_ASM_000534 /LENGTH=228 /DNA_ID=CAMNT_0042808937 /DNA_START=30 /DNA_END=716 /DNA_ORIENTATION=+
MKLIRTRKFTVLGIGSELLEAFPLSVEENDGWNAAAPISFVSTVLDSRRSQEFAIKSDDDWVLVEKLKEEEEKIEEKEEETAEPLRTVGEWAEFVDPETGCTYWFNAVTKASSWEPPSEYPGGVDATNPLLEIQYIRDVQQKLVKIVAAMHQRLVLFEARDREREEDIKRLAASIDDLEFRIPREKPGRTSSQHQPGGSNRAATYNLTTLDKALAAAIRAEDIRLFKR